jgi:hypothetical protein
LAKTKLPDLKYDFVSHELIPGDDYTRQFDARMLRQAQNSPVLSVDDLVKKCRYLFPDTTRTYSGKEIHWPSRFDAGKGLVTGWPGEFKMYHLSAWTKFLVVQAMAEARKEIPVIVAANKGKSAEVEQLVKRAGGSILKTIPEIDYVRGILPTDKFWWLIEQEPVTDLMVARNHRVHKRSETRRGAQRSRDRSEDRGSGESAE